MQEWHLVRTKAGKEVSVRGQLSEWLPEAFLPTLKVRIHRWGKLVISVGPLFPCYVFARFPAQCDLLRLNYTSGVREVVRGGKELLVVPSIVIDELKARCATGPVELLSRLFHKGEKVTIAYGTLKGFEAVFEQYLSGPQRVAILLSSLTETSIRVVLPASSIVRNEM
jgi:transcriptional antiterminator RfaH